jgi:O-antigen/teichoic acid export membrane protein
LYQIPFKIINALQFLPLAFIATVYPAFSSYWLNNRNQIMITFERAMNYLIIISLPISIGIFALADKIVYLFKDQYNDAILPLQITMLALIFMFINYPVGAILNACDKQKDNTRNMLVVLIVSVIMNLILIPIYKTIGASITLLATNILMFILGIYCVPKIITLRIGVIFKFFLKIFLAALIMGLLVFYLKNFLNIFVVVIISGTIYFLLIFAFRAVKREDITSIYHSFIKS